LSKKELDKKRAQDKKRAELIASGVIKEGDEIDEKTENKKASHMIRNKK
jgi:hypothetical protein